VRDPFAACGLAPLLSVSRRVLECLVWGTKTFAVTNPFDGVSRLDQVRSDKSRPHNDTPLYSALLKERFDQPLRILELNLGSINPDVPSNMGLFGVPGASLRGWRELFPRAVVYGADIDRTSLLQEDRIKTFYCDQLDQSIRELCRHSDLQVWISSSRMVCIILKPISPSWKGHSITFVWVAFR
jgi:hypothetical protein